MENYEQKHAKGRIWRTVIMIVVAALILILIIVGVTAKPAPGDQVWDQKTTIGNLDAKNYYVMYTDLMCPYCDVFSREVMNHWDEFQQFLAANDILFEIRLTDYLYEGNNIQSSRDAAEATYCATRENKFWEYYHAALASLWEDYHSKGIGTSKTATPIKDMPADYWQQIGHEAGLGDQFDECLGTHATVDDIVSNTQRAARVADGMPTFKFNQFTSSGFDNNWDWEYVKAYLNAGLKN